MSTAATKPTPQMGFFQQPAGKLLVVGTPIGNLEDLSPRAAKALATADLIAAEDTRRARALLSHLGLSRPLVSYFDANEAQRVDGLIKTMREGRVVALISESGMPLISDPGYRLVSACANEKIPMEVIPGPSAVLLALCGSGLPVHQFRFVGFLPRRPGVRQKRLAELARESVTMIFFEAANRLAQTLEVMQREFGDRQAVIARELTRVHEEFVRGSLSELLAWSRSTPPRGQITLVVGQAPPRQPLGNMKELDPIVTG